MGFTMLLLFQFGLMTLSFTQTEGLLHNQVGALLCVLAPLCYLTTALRNPGRYEPSECHEPKTR